MFCPNCGISDQTPDAYCRQCGEWLPDLGSRTGGPFKISTREQKVTRMRVLQMVSIGLSLTSAGIIFNFLSTGRDKEMLTLAAICGFLVAVYQIISLILGYKVLIPKVDRGSDSAKSIVGQTLGPALNAADTNELIKPDSVVENTTELLVKVPNRPRSDEPE